LGLKPFLSDRWATGEVLEAIQAYPESRFLWQSHARGNLQHEERAAISKLMPGSRNPFANFKDLFERYGDHDPASQQMIVDFSTYLPEQILTMMDRATMAASIEGRVPFLDNNLVDFAFSLSASAKMGVPPNGKQVLKRAIAQDVSRGILDRKKAGMPSPFVYYLAQNSGTLRQILLARDSYVRSILPEEWLRRITATPDTVRASFRVLYAILVLEIWHKLFIREKIYTKPDMTAADLFKIGSPVIGA
jgi:asparagine synthase (glutamine-hydrolysing)